jgi:hypothetical protein
MLYYEELNERKQELVESGFIKFSAPIYNFCDLDELVLNINKNKNQSTYISESIAHKNILATVDFEKKFTKILFDLATNKFNYNGAFDNQYHITRIIKSGNKYEGFRSHFDSHLFTLVLPIKIPKIDVCIDNGELIYFPKFRTSPKNDLINFYQKMIYKIYSSRIGAEYLLNNIKYHEDNFSDYRPLLFLGNSTLHMNRELMGVNKERITFLSHFFDPFGKMSIGNILRYLRNR